MDNAEPKSGAWPGQGGQPPTDSVAWVVGVGNVQGTGGALARRLAREGLKVVITGRTPEKLREVVAAIEAEGGIAIAAPGDATSDAGLVDALAIVRAAGALRVAVYNAGGSQWRASILDMDTEFFENVWRINCLGGLIVGRESARIMVEHGGGAILFTGSTSSVVTQPKLTAYAGAKFGLRAVAQGLAHEFWSRGIHVAHALVEAAIDGDRFTAAFPDAKAQRPPDSLIDIDALADSYWHIITQPRSCWTHEFNLRPYSERFK